jgi:type 2 lantibiotic biosynthesis protein LanM
MRSVWFAALNVRERGRPPESVTATEQSRLWTNQPPFDERPALWEERLRVDGITDEDLRRLIDEPLASLASRIAPPRWMHELEEALTATFDLDPTLERAVARAASNDHRAWLLIVAPFVQHRMGALHGALDVLRAASVPVDETAVLDSIVAHVPLLVGNAIGPSVTFELQVARGRGLLEGETPQARFDCFIDALTDREVLPSFWERHPVLARHVFTMIDGYFRAYTRMIGHLTEDWSAVQSELELDSASDLVAIEPGAGDTHRGGLTVMKLKLAPRDATGEAEKNRKRHFIVYKPRSADADLGYARVLRWLAERAPSLPRLVAPRVVSREDRSYHAFVDPAQCRTRDELARFFERQGMHLALLFILGVGDVHSENMIASGEHPVLVDLEAMLQPQMYRASAEINPASALAMSSVLGSLFLPFRVEATDEAPGYDISALGAHSGQRAAQEHRVLVNLGTDDMRAVLERPLIEAIGSRPMLDGVEADAGEWIAEIVEGFSRAWQTVGANAEDFIAGPLASIRDIPIRVIVRATMSYFAFLIKSFHPSNVATGLERERLFDHLYIAATTDPALTRLIPAEREDLHEGDIPIFAMLPTTRDVIDARGRVIADYFSEAPWDAALRRIRALDAARLAEQVRLIIASFATVTIGKGTQSWKASNTRLAPAPASRDHLLVRAERIGDRLAELAVWQNEHVGWLGLDLVRDRDWTILPARTDLYAGAPGIALFLGQLGAILNATRFTELARAALGTSLLELEQLTSGSTSRRLPIGISSGLVGPIYALAHLGSLWNDTTLLDRADSLAASLDPHLDDAAELDIIEGAAGCALAMLALDSIRTSTSARAVLRRTTELLVQSAIEIDGGVAWRSKGQAGAPLGGFSHGASGIAFALRRIAQHHDSRDAADQVNALARRALVYERSLFDASRRSWRDLRRVALDEAAPGEAPFMSAWCHGAPGIGLAFLDVPGFEEDARVAVESTHANGFGLNHSLCHGDFGNLELLFLTRHHHHTNEDAFRERLGRTCASLDREGPLAGVPLGVETPGLFVGLAGIGWQLLRFAESTRVPSLLLFEPPRASTT